MRLAIALLALSSLLCGGGARAADVAIGLAAPLSGSFASLGQQMREGTETAAAGFSGATIILDTYDDKCSAKGGAGAARKFVQDHVNAVVGFLCTDAVEAAMPILKDAGIVVITPGVRTDSLTDNRSKTGWPVFRIASRNDDEGAAIGSLLIDYWRNVLFAIIDDGTIYGRGLADTMRADAEQQRVKPAFIDNYRAAMDNQIGLAFRIKRAGVTHIFIGGAREDVSMIGRDAAKVGLKLQIAGGEALRASSENAPLPPGTLMVAPPDWTKPTDANVAEQFQKNGIEPEGYILPAYAALQIAATAVSQASAAGKTPQDILSNGTFQTAIGSIRFDGKGDLAQNPDRLFRYDGTSFQEVKTP